MMGTPIMGHSVNVEMPPNLQSCRFIAAMLLWTGKVVVCKTQVPGMEDTGDLSGSIMILVEKPFRPYIFDRLVGLTIPGVLYAGEKKNTPACNPSWQKERYRACCNRCSTVVAAKQPARLWVPSCHDAPAFGAFFFITGFTLLMLYLLTALGADAKAACIHPASPSPAGTRSFFSAFRFFLPWHLSLLIF